MTPTLYAIGGLSVALLLAGSYAALENSWRKNAQLQVAVEQEANKRNQETIRILEDANALSGKISLELSEQLGALASKKEEDDAAVTELATSDEEVGNFLRTPVPDKLRCLWEHKKCPDGTAGTDPGKAGTVR